MAVKVFSCRDQGGREERGGALDWVFVIANKAVGWGWDGITGSGVRGPFGARQDYVPGQKRLSGRYAGIKTQQSRVLQCSMTVAVWSGVDGVVDG